MWNTLYQIFIVPIVAKKYPRYVWIKEAQAVLLQNINSNISKMRSIKFIDNNCLWTPSAPWSTVCICVHALSGKPHNFSKVPPVFAGLTPFQFCSLISKAMMAGTNVQFIHGELKAVKSGSLIHVLCYICFQCIHVFLPAIRGYYFHVYVLIINSNIICEVIPILMSEFQEKCQNWIFSCEIYKNEWDFLDL